MLFRRFEIAFCQFETKLGDSYQQGILYVDGWYASLALQNVTVFLPKTLLSFFQMQEKLETCRNLNFINSRRPSFGDDINVTFML